MSDGQTHDEGGAGRRHEPACAAARRRGRADDDEPSTTGQAVDKVPEPTVESETTEPVGLADAGQR